MARMPRFPLLVATLSALWLPAPVTALGPMEPCVPIPGVNDRCPIWATTYDNSEGDAAGSEVDWAMDVAVDPGSGRVFVTGNSWDNRTGGFMGQGRAPGGNDVATIALDPATGARLWTHRYDGPSSYWDTATDIEVAPDGETVFVVGVQEQHIVDLQYLLGEYLVLAIDADTGQRRWAASYRAGRELELSQANDVAVSPDGEEIYVTGQSGDAFPAGQDWDLATVAFDAGTGEQLWEARHSSELYVSGSIRKSPDAAMAIDVDPDGRRVYVTGHKHGGRGLNEIQFVTIAYEAEDEEHLGEELWVATHAAAPDTRSMGRRLGVSPDGRTVVVAGEFDFQDRPSLDPDISSFGTVAYDAATGERRWASTWMAPDTPTDRLHVPEELVISPDGTRAFVVGRSSGLVGLSETFSVVAYGIDSGAELWAETWDALAARQSVARAAAVSANGARLYVAGVASPGPPHKGGEFATIALDTATGSVAWAARYGLTTTEDHESAQTVAVAPGGGVIVAGAVISGSSSSAPAGDKGDYTIVRYPGT